MKNLSIALGFALAASGALPAFAQGVHCAERAAEEPSYPYKLATHFTLELSARADEGKIGQGAYDAAMAELEKANAELSNLRTEEGCLILERVARQFKLTPPAAN